MNLVTLLGPTNLAEEKAKFFADFSYNPFFTYKEKIPTDALQRWGVPTGEFVAKAKKILEKRSTLHLERNVIENEIIRQRCLNTLKEVGVKENIEIVFVPGKLTRCSVTKEKITFRDPSDFASEVEFQGTINHEVQTHLLRNLNQRKQGWSLDRDNHDGKILRTEEGLAVLHALLPDSEKIFWRAAAYYVAVDLGMKMSFTEMFQELLHLGFDKEFSWRLSIRVKRGLTDTSQPGGNTKDICYMEGAFQMMEWLINSDNNPRDLYLGKIYLEELEIKKNMAQVKDVYYPTFFKDLDAYRKNISEIKEANS